MQNAIRQKIQLSLTFWVACIPVLIVDQASKWWVLNRIPVQPEGMGLRLDEPFAFTVVPRLLAFIHTRNEGAAFSIFQTMPALLTLIAAGLAVAVLVWALFFLPAPERLSRISLGLIFGGAVGNLVDRVLHDLHVVDFILVLIQYKGRLWPTFNVADMAICVGIGLF
ncbi:signal peptidase II, partial [bacterium]|nr:signal peptidase II [bacterium]